MTDMPLSSIEDILDDARNGRMFILVDDEDRENEGDLIIPAQMATPEAINFMAKFGRGLICLSLTPERVEQLGLKLMHRQNSTRHHTAFTTSIEAREGVTTGISAADRAHTVAVAIDPTKAAGDIATPGHVFPLVAREGGVLVRAGHTEAAVDIARLAGLNPAGVICEIMNDDGTMARMPDLIRFAQTHALKIAAIADLIAYRRRREKLVRRVIEAPFNSRFGGSFHMMIYANTIEYAEHIVLVKGEIHPDKPTLVRMHASDALADVLGENDQGREGLLEAAMQQIARHGSGVIVLIREPRRNSVSEKIRAQLGHTQEKFTGLRDYGIGAQILLDLGVKEMLLLSNSKRPVVGLEGYGLTIAGYRPVIKEP